MRFLFVVLAAVLSLLPLAAEEVPFVQDGALSPRWEKQSGTIAVLDDPFEVAEKSLRCTDGARLLLKEPLTLAAGDGVRVMVAFRGKGKNEARAVFGMCDKDGNIACSKTINCYNGDWDKRQVVFDIAETPGKPLFFFCATAPGETLQYAAAECFKLKPEETALYSTSAQEAAWKKASMGENLALGKKVTFAPVPNYQLTSAGGTDETDLTDGQLTKNPALWFEKGAVAWSNPRRSTSVTVDLGEVQQLDRAAIRICGGRDYMWAVSFPKKLELWVSRDGRDFHLAQCITKLNALECDMSDWKTQYYLPETYDFSGISYPYSFVLDIKADARYVMFRVPISQPVTMVCDELAVIKATEKTAPWNAPYLKPAEELEHESIVVRPMMDTFYIPENIFLSNWLRLDCRIKEKVETFEYAIELPKEIEFRQDTVSWPAWIRILKSSEIKGGRTVFRFGIGNPYDKFKESVRYGFGPFYFKLRDNAVIPDSEQYVVFTTYINGKEGRVRRLPLKTLVIPDASAIRRSDISVWYEERFLQGQPDWTKVMRHCGITTQMFFPRKGKVATELVEEARRAGMGVRYELEPTNEMMIPVNFPEVRCVTPNTAQKSCCLVYRGEKYQETIRNVEDTIKAAVPDSVTFDIECWEPNHMNNAMLCKNCQALREKMNVSWVEYFSKMQADYVKEYTLAVRRAAKEMGKEVRVGFYAVQPFMAYSCREGKVPFLGYPHLYPAYCDEIQNSYYGRDTRGAHDQMRKVYGALGGKSRKFVPWLTVGTGAYYDFACSERNGQHVLEVLMNGAGGVQFYCRKSFESPLDWYYVAQALAMIAPYEDIVADGTVDFDLKGSNPVLIYSARRLGKKTLLLAGNYGVNKTSEFSLSLKALASVKDLTENNRQLTIKDGTFSDSVPADKFRLYLLETR